MEAAPDDRAGGRHGAWRPGAALRASLRASLLTEEGRWFLWAPVALMAGVALYFALPREPFLPALAALALLLALAGRRARDRPVAFVLVSFLALVAAGATLGRLRAAMVAAPVLERTLVSARVTGWVEEAERRQDGRARLTVRVAAIERLAAARTPRRVLVSLRGGIEPSRFAPGAPVGFSAFLQAPPEPVAPGAYDFARASFFRGIGGVGIVHRTPEPWTGAPPAPLALRLAALIDRARWAIAARVRGGLAGEAGVLAAALITGRRDDISEPTLEALRAAGLAHILAISGLHMALVAGSLFWLVRAGLAAVPALAVRYSVKEIAAAGALAGASVYLLLSGASVATQRAYVMMTVMLVAVMLRRPAITMRNVALAALVVIVIAPEAILSASFQMSFAAATALVAAFELRARRRRDGRGREGRAWARAVRAVVLYFGAILLTTLIASAATAPFAAYHFHRAAPFGLLGNLLAMPAVGLVVMPAGLTALIAMPFGVDPLALRVMGAGIDWVLAAARFVAGLPGAELHMAQVPHAALLLVVAGFLWLALWRGPWRLAGLGAFAAGLFVALLARPPDVLIDRSGATVAVRRAQDGRLSLLTRSPGGFAASRWLEADGDARGAEEITGAAFACDEAACVAPLPDGGTFALVRDRAALEEECRRARILVVRFALVRRCVGPRLVLDARDLEARGAHALWLDAGRVTARAARPVPGARPWAGHAPVARDGAESRTWKGEGKGEGKGERKEDATPAPRRSRAPGL